MSSESSSESSHEKRLSDDKTSEVNNWDNRDNKTKDKKSTSANDRGQYGSYVEFLLSAVGYCIGFGNIWRFPYRTFANGGGAFLIPYAVIMLTMGIPYYLMEEALAQYSSRGPTAIWHICPLFKGIGYSMYILNFLGAIYYNVVLGWVIYYLVNSFTTQLPWDGCDHYWNSDRCNQPVKQCSEQDGVMDDKVCRYNFTAREMFIQQDNSWISSAEEFWVNKALSRSPGIDEMGSFLLPQYAAFVIAQVLIYFILIKGVQSSGKVVYVTATAPFILLFVLFVRGLTLPGMANGLKFFIQPDFNKLTDVTVWGSAANQIVYTLGLGFGGIHTISSFKKFDTNCVRDTWIVSSVNVATSLFAGFTIFSIMGFLAHEMHTDVSKAVRDGMGLAFIAYPDVTLQLPGSFIWSILFFLMMVNIGVDTVFVGVETIVAPILDEFPRLEPHRKYVTAFVIILITVLAIPMCTTSGIYWFSLLDWYTAWYPLFLLELIQGVVIAYIYGVDRFALDIQTMTGKPVGFFWKVCWLVVSPTVLFLVLLINLVQYSSITLGDYKFPLWAELLGWAIMTIEFLPIPLYAMYRVCNTPGDSIIERILINLRPSPQWGPSDPEDRERNNQLIIDQLGSDYITLTTQS
ncbi:sodium- and chloride-dependent glycine transporter 2-like [Convolutriloba macropyga]|uniref:sodium- and chloride-dependent glycine transporter 2-like n=1 Tax=Convolutriloba macropyga TaxID=536237 RepID=UPI003F5208CD